MAWTPDASAWPQRPVPNTSEPWSCRNCARQCNPKCKACPACGLRRSWQAASVSYVTTPMASPPATPTAPNPISQQLSSVSAMLETTVQQMTTDVVVCPTDSDTSPQARRRELRAQIKAFEAALTQLPEGPLLSATRDTLTAEITRTKKRITELRPVVARLDACREALQRASTRQAQLQETARLTHSALQASKTEVQRFTLQLSSLEAAVAKQEKSPNCLDQLKGGMEACLRMLHTNAAARAAQPAAAPPAAQAADCPVPTDLDTDSARASTQIAADLSPGATLAPASPP